MGKKLTEYKEKLGQTEDPVAKAELKATIDALESKIAELEGTISLLQAAIKEKGINKLETAYQAKAQMTFQQFCQQVLGQSAATAKQMNDLWLVYASGKVKGGDTPPAAEPFPVSCCTTIPRTVLGRTPLAETVRPPTIIPTVRPKRHPAAAVLKARAELWKALPRTPETGAELATAAPTQMKTVPQIPAAERTAERTTAADPKRIPQAPQIRLTLKTRELKRNRMRRCLPVRVSAVRWWT